MTGPLESSVLRARFAPRIIAARVVAVLSGGAARVAGRSIVALVLLAAQVVQPTSAPASAAAAPVGKPFVAFGPTDDVREAGRPKVVTATFAVLNPAASYVLRLTNGGLQGQFPKVRTATITLNGVRVVGPKDFRKDSDDESDDDDRDADPNVPVQLEKPVTLLAADQISISVRGRRGAGLTVQVIGYDNDAPTIAATASPAANAAGWNDTNVTVNFACADKTSGVAICPSPVTVSTEGAGQVISGTATDKAGNTASTSITVNIDKTQPTVSVSAPISGAALNTKTPSLTATANDALSGVANVQFQVSANNGATWTNVGAAVSTAPYQATVSSPLVDGNYLARAVATDGAGNQATSPTVAFLIDTIPPTVGISQPVPNATTNSRILAATALDSGSGVASVQFQLSPDNGTTWTNVGSTLATAPYQTSLPTIQADGPYQVRAQAADNAGNQATSAAVAFSLETTAPHTTITGHPDASTTQTSASFTFTSDQPGVTFTCQLDGGAFTPCASPQTYASLAVGSHTFAVRGTDPAGNVEQTPAMFGWTITPASSGLPQTGPPPAPVPPAPSTIAPALDNTVATSVQTATSFLYTGNNPIQTGVAPGTIQPQRAAVIHGTLLTRAGQALPGATIGILQHPELGQTVSQADGSYDLAANGGGLLTLNYALNGYLPAQRQVQVPWQDYVNVDPVMLVPLDTTVTAVDLTSSAPIQVARGSVATDTDGTRQATLLVPQGTTAMMTLANGTTQPVTTPLHVRATEYTVGTNQPQAMPAGLPPTSGYTYAVELSADEAWSAGASQLSFSQPLAFYLENFLQFPTGGVVPVGFYDKSSANWIASTNGVVVKVLSITNGVASLDVDGSGKPATAAQLSSLGITTAELTQVGALYAVGQALWRVQISHFSTYDPNWPVGPPPDAQAPDQHPPTQGANWPPISKDCHQGGSDIGCESQSLGEESPVAGTGFTLHYQSARQAANLAASTLRIPLSGPTPPASLKRIDLDIFAAGQHTSVSFAPSPNLTYDFVWNGKDGYGRTVQGRQIVTVRISYVYPALYMTPAQQGAAFARFPSSGARAVSIGCCHPREDIVLAQTWQGEMRVWDDKAGGLGGWSLSVHHAYDPIGKVLYLGTGQDRSAEAQIAPVITTVAGNGNSGFSGDGGPATKAALGIAQVNQTGEAAPATDVTVGPDGSLFIADAGNNRIRRVDPSGVISTVAGNGTAGYSGDGGLATQAELNSPRAVVLGQDGSLYIGDFYNQRIRRVSPKGTITTFAGAGSGCQQQTDALGDGCPANQAVLSFFAGGTANFPVSIALAQDGSLFITDIGNRRIRRVGPDGIITTVTGCTPTATTCDNLFFIAPIGLAVGPDGSLFIADSADDNRVWRVGLDGIIRPVAGSGGHGVPFPGFGDGGLATQTPLNNTRVAVAGDGRIFFVDLAGCCAAGQLGDRIRLVNPDGIITTVAAYTGASLGDGGFATRAALGPAGVAVAPDGSVYIVDAADNRIRRVAPAFPGLSVGAVGIASEDGSEVYVFDSDGRHLRTQNALTGAVLYQFEYDSVGHLSTITDGNGNKSTIEHDANGSPTAIDAPFGQQTRLTVDANGYLSMLADPSGNIVQLSSNAAGLLASMTDARGGVHNFSFDSLGRLTKDQEPDGSAKTLVRSELLIAQVIIKGVPMITAGYEVTVTTSLGRSTTYIVEQLSNGSVQRTIVAPDGTQTVSVTATDGSTTTTVPDGTITASVLGPDPRFGILTPIGSSYTMRTPGGLTSTTTMSRTVSLSDPTNLLSLTRQTDTVVVNGQTSTRVYNASTRTFTDTTPARRTRTTTTDTLGHVVSQQVGNLLPVTYSYDSNGRLSTITQGAGAIARAAALVYNPQGFLATITDPLGRQTQLSYDAAGRVTQQVLPGNRTVSYAYDGDSNVISITPPGQPAHSFTYTPVDLQSAYTPPDVGAGTNQTLDSYNSDRQLTQVSLPTGQSISLGYDSSGRLNSIGIPRGTTSFGYDNAGRMSNVIAPGGLGLSYGYDGGLLTSEAWTGTVAGSVARTYDTNFRTTGVSVDGANSVAFGYDPDSLMTSAGSESLTYTSQSGLLNTTALGVVSDQWTYDGFGAPTAYTATANGSAAYSVRYVRDQLGRNTSKSETIAGATSTTTYTYDAAGRLATVTTGAGTTTYTYDLNGNRLQSSGPARTVTGTYDAQDRLLSYGTNTYTYTADGQLRTKTDSATNQTTTYQYDELGNLVGVTLPDGTQIGYLVDGQNRRVGKTVNGVTVQRFLYQDGLRLIAQLDGNNNVISRFIYATGKNVPDYMVNGGATYRLLSDQVGSPRLVVNSSTGAVVDQINYDAFGNVLAETNPGFQPFGFAGGLTDAQTGLTRFGARDYDSVTGRWTAKDRMGFAARDSNLYAYVGGDPINETDFGGACPCPQPVQTASWSATLGIVGITLSVGGLIAIAAGVEAPLLVPVGVVVAVFSLAASYQEGDRTGTFWSGVGLPLAFGSTPAIAVVGLVVGGLSLMTPRPIDYGPPTPDFSRGGCSSESTL